MMLFSCSVTIDGDAIDDDAYLTIEYMILKITIPNTNNVTNANLQSLSAMKLITEIIIRMIGVIINNKIPAYK